MKRLVVMSLLAAVLTVSSARTSWAVDEYEETQSHPLRVATYIVYPVGVLLEWMFFRPFHYLVSQPELESVFGHEPHGMSEVN